MTNPAGAVVDHTADQDTDDEQPGCDQHQGIRTGDAHRHGGGLRSYQAPKRAAYGDRGKQPLSVRLRVQIVGKRPEQSNDEYVKDPNPQEENDALAGPRHAEGIEQQKIG